MQFWKDVNFQYEKIIRHSYTERSPKGRVAQRERYSIVRGLYMNVRSRIWGVSRQLSERGTK